MMLYTKITHSWCPYGVKNKQTQKQPTPQRKKKEKRKKLKRRKKVGGWANCSYLTWTEQAFGSTGSSSISFITIATTAGTSHRPQSVVRNKTRHNSLTYTPCFIPVPCLILSLLTRLKLKHALFSRRSQIWRRLSCTVTTLFAVNHSDSHAVW